MQDFSDDQLRDYLAGQLEASEADAIEAHLASSPALEERLLALEPFTDGVRSAFADVPDADRLSQLVPSGTPRRRARWGWGLALAASLAGVIGFGLGNMSGSEPTLDWRAQIAIYQSLYVPDTIAMLNPTDADLRRQFATGSKKLGIDIAPEALRGLDSLSLKRAQILDAEQRPIVQIVLAADDGEPLAFCIARLGEGTEPTDIIYEQMAGVPTAHWVDDGYGFMIVGRVDAEIMKVTSRALRARF